MNLKKIDLDALLLMFDNENRPGQLTLLANEIAERADPLALDSLVQKYRSDMPVSTKTAILFALGSITTGAPTEFFAGILEQEPDIKPEQLYNLFMAMCNGQDSAKVNDISSGMSEYTDHKGWPEMAEKVMQELYPDGFGTEDEDED